MAFNDPRWADVTQSIVGAIAGPDPARRAQSEAALGQAARGYAAADLDRQTSDYREQLVQAILNPNTRAAMAYAAGAGGEYAKGATPLIAGQGALPGADITPEIASNISAIMGVQDMKDTPAGLPMVLANNLAARSISASRGGGGGASGAPAEFTGLTSNQRLLLQNAIKPFMAKADPSLPASVQNEVIRLIRDEDMMFEDALADVTERIGRPTVVNPGGTWLSRALGLDTSPDVYEEDTSEPFTLLDPDKIAGLIAAAPVDPTQPAQGGNEDVLAQARAAIAAGADREAVIARLRANNIDPAGL